MVAPNHSPRINEEDFICELDPLIEGIAKRKARAHPRLDSHVDDLIQEARIKVLSVYRQNNEKILEPKYQGRVIRNAMTEYIREHVFLKKSAFRPRRLHNRILEFLDELGIPKTKAQYIDVLTTSMEATKLFGKEADLREKAEQLWDDFGPTPAAVNVITHLREDTHRQPSISSNQINETDRRKIRDLFVEAMIRKQDSKLLKIFYAIIFEEKESIEIAAELGLSNGRISQIMNKRTLRHRLQAQASQLVRALEELY